MTFPWLLVLGTIGWTVIGTLVALAFGRFIRGAAKTPAPSRVSRPPWALARLDDRAKNYNC